jgi:hypothetical protein
VNHRPTVTVASLILSANIHEFFIISGVTSTEDIFPSSTNTEDGGLLEELCETLILTIVMILWKGVAGSDEEAWMVCLFIQIFIFITFLLSFRFVVKSSPHFIIFIENMNFIYH